MTTNKPQSVAFLTVDHVIALHTEAIRRVTPTEALTITDRGRLEAAVMQPQQTFDGDYLYRSIIEMAAAYLIGLAGNHPFENGNKRVAFAACSVFLEMNGLCLTLSEDQATTMTLRVVRHDLDRDQTVLLLRDFTKPL
ncbi:MAG: type II toxin-antitoxin system death-on-curing family toxin [Capsulimonadaceae bacterium]|nr:type II toxin-antitoxin system death-on-curing family toxin [Capsulimonadaceae bacterium]